ncbi:MAG: DUF3267 domain-containing protein [Anaerolineae bacterium]|nr:DUF3267 domain-containing protein [Anaerolineae bacterium]
MWNQAANPVTALPANYRQVYYLRLTERGRLLWLNVLSLVPLAISGVVVIILLIAYHSVGAPLVIDALPGELPTLYGMALVLLVLPLHEWLHGLAIRRVGHRPRYGVRLLVLFATADGAYFRRGEFIQVSLAPLVVISAAGLFLMLFLPLGLAQWIALAVMMNAAGAIGDLWMALVALRFDPSVLVQDEEDAMRIFAHVEVR